MNVQTDYVRIGNKTFGLTEIDGEAIDINAELKEFYEHRHEALADEMGAVLNQGAQTEWDTQIAHLRRRTADGSIKVPESLFKKPVAVMNGEVCEVRMIVYAPNVLCTDRRYLRNGNCLWEGVEDLADGTSYEFHIKPKFQIPLALAYHTKNKPDVHSRCEDVPHYERL